MMTCVQPMASSIPAQISPVNAPSFSQDIFCAPTATRDPLGCRHHTCRSIKGGQITISSATWSATRGKRPGQTLGLRRISVLHLPISGD